MLHATVARAVRACVPTLFGSPRRCHSPRADDLTVKLNQHVYNYNLGTFNFVDAFIGVLAIAAIWLPGLAQAESKRIAGLPRNGVPAGRSDMQKAFVGKTEPRV